MADSATATLPAGTPAGPTSPAAPSKLDDVMMAMDVVDTLRHQELVATRELDDDAREAQLVQRLREIYRAQGIEVTDAVIAEGVKALKESRFVYTPVGPSLNRTLATLWVERAAWGKRGAIGLGLIVAAFAGYHYAVVVPRERAAETLRLEFAETLPKQLDEARAAVLTEAKVAPAREAAERLTAEGRAAIAAKDRVAADKAIADLGAILAKLRLDYVLRVVSRPGEQSGVWRIPKANPNGRNYYLIVEAIGANGAKLKLPITSEEDQSTTTVDKWAVRVPQATFEAVAADKRDDGIVQNNRVGAKSRGSLEPDYAMPVANGAITKW